MPRRQRDDERIFDDTRPGQHIVIAGQAEESDIEVSPNERGALWLAMQLRQRELDAPEAVLGGAGGVVGAFGGYQARTRLVRALHVPDCVIACSEDLIAIGGSLLIVSRF